MWSTSVTAQEAQARADIYSFLAAVFTSHPSEESVRGIHAMASTLGVPCSNGFSLDELDREYMELFVIPNPRYVAPYESVFRDRWLLPAALKPGSNPAETGLTIKGLLMGESTLQVRQCYLEAGLLPDEDLPDHIGNELRFMAYLWAKEAGSLPDEAQVWAELRAKFRQEHLLKWIGQLHEHVVESDQLGFYRVALQVAEVMLQNDSSLENLDEILTYFGLILNALLV